MTVVALGSVRSCGVTTVGVALAATWPAGRRILLVELDPAGGSLAGASGWPPEPSLVSLAAAARRGLDPEEIWEHCQSLPGDAAVLAGPASAEQAATARGMLTGLGAAFARLDTDVLVDCGRLDSSRPAETLEGVDRVVLAARPRLADLHSLSTWLDAHRPTISLGLVTVGDGPYPDHEVAEALGVEVLARIPWDPHAAAGLLAMAASERELRLAPLVRAARTLAHQLAPTATAGQPGGAHREEDVASARSTVLSPVRLWQSWRPKARTASSSNGAHPEEVAE